MKPPVKGERVYVDSNEPYYHGYALFIEFQMSTAGVEQAVVMIADGTTLRVEKTCLKKR